MSRSAQLRVSKTRSIPVPNVYIQALLGEYSPWSYDEERAPTFRGQWRRHAFANLPESTPLDVEMGTGNGTHFAHRTVTNPARALLGFELRYKPLIQSIRRARRAGCENMRIARYNASLVQELFTPGEINDVFIFFPDPWEKGRNHKHRLIQVEFLDKLYECQRPGSRLYFKTDSQDYFQWSVRRFESSRYEMEAMTSDLHQSAYAKDNFITQFENIFIRQGLPIGYAQLLRR
jgi:tRNA (guanine-N7-)-methyltransferase